MSAVTVRRARGELEPVVFRATPVVAAKLRLAALKAWELEPRRLGVHPLRAEEEREEFVQRWIGLHIHRLVAGAAVAS